jgi:hypothetical protein
VLIHLTFTATTVLLKKLRPKGVKQLDQEKNASQWPSRNLNIGSLAPKSIHPIAFQGEFLNILKIKVIILVVISA